MQWHTHGTIAQRQDLAPLHRLAHFNDHLRLAADMLRQRQHQFVGYPGIQHRARG